MSRGGMRFVGPYVSHDSVQLLTEALEQAKKGEVVGVGIVTLLNRRRFSIGTTGTVESEPFTAIAATALLAASLLKRIMEET